MKSLRDYTNDPQRILIEELGAFFAFSNAQFDEAKREGVTYCNLGGGLIAPKENVQALVSGIEDITKKGIEQDLQENGRTNIIRRELDNLECYLSGRISDCVDALKGYGITREEILGVF